MVAARSSIPDFIHVSEAIARVKARKASIDTLQQAKSDKTRDSQAFAAEGYPPTSKPTPKPKLFQSQSEFRNFLAWSQEKFG